MELDPENIYKVNAENMYLRASLEGIIETQKKEIDALKEKLEASENSVSRLNAEILMMNEEKKREKAISKNKLHPKFQKSRGPVIHWSELYPERLNNAEHGCNKENKSPQTGKALGQLENKPGEIWDVTKIDFKAITGRTLSDWLINSKPKFDWSSSSSGHIFGSTEIENIAKVQTTKTDRILPAKNQESTKDAALDKEKPTNEALRNFFQGLLDKHTPASTTNSRLPPKLTSSILIIHGLTDDIRNQHWLEERLGSYGHLQKITLG